MNINYQINPTLSAKEFINILNRSTLGDRIRKMREQLGSKCKIILLSAPLAVEYYPKIGFMQHSSAWVLDRSKEIL